MFYVLNYIFDFDNLIATYTISKFRRCKIETAVFVCSFFD